MVGRATPFRPRAAAADISAAALSRWVSRIAITLAALGVWQVLAGSGRWGDALPAPLAVLARLTATTASGELPAALAMSLARIAFGYVFSVVSGVALGALLALSRRADSVLGPISVGMQSLPSVCWLPIALLWFGPGEFAIQFVIVSGALFSIALGVRDGVRNTPPAYAHAARNLGARGAALFLQVLLPAGLPAIVAGLKLGWAFSWRGLMASELLVYSLSLGGLLKAGRDGNDAALMFAVMIVIIAIGVLVNQLVFANVERRISERWGFRR
jgi:NitT/TauT family transport system permease protein